MATLTLTRSQYDFLIDTNQPLLQRAVDEATGRRWSLAGVEYEGLDCGLIEQIKEAVSEVGSD